jgi:hypothetical protein
MLSRDFDTSAMQPIQISSVKADEIANPNSHADSLSTAISHPNLLMSIDLSVISRHPQSRHLDSNGCLLSLSIDLSIYFT